MKSSAADSLLARSVNALELLVKAAEPYEGHIPSLLKLDEPVMLYGIPPCITGQRSNERCPLGSNLLHDHRALRALFDIARCMGRPELAAAADRYLRHFATQCTDTPTGLFPWGEHAYWDIANGRIGGCWKHVPLRHNIPIHHDHLCQAAPWLWEKLWEYNSHAVVRFGEGLDFHWSEGEGREYQRHAYLLECRPQVRYPHAAMDWPRHSGFYIVDWSFIFARTGDRNMRARIVEMLDYWWNKREPDGLCACTSRTVPEDKPIHNIINLDQTLSLGLSLLDAAVLLRERDDSLAGTARDRGKAYAEAFLAGQHGAAAGQVIATAERHTGNPVQIGEPWGRGREGGRSSRMANLCLCALRNTGDSRFLDFALAVAEAHRGAVTPADPHIPAFLPAGAVALHADLYDLTGEQKWCEEGLRIAADVAGVYLDRPLPRGATGIDWYESQLGTSDLLHALTRMALVARDGPGKSIDPDYTRR